MKEQSALPRARRKPRSLAQELVTILTERIRDGHLKRGDKLPTESAIMEEQGVSRTVVREALSKLQASGLVETRHGIGTFVLAREASMGLRLNVDTAASVRGILELRMGLEVQAAALAAVRRSDEQLRQMRQALDEYQALLENNDCCVEPDQRFHQLIAQATGNSHYTDIMQHLGEAMIPRTRVNVAERGSADFSKLAHLANLEHESILAAIGRQDPDAARAAMLLHLSNSMARLS